MDALEVEERKKNALYARMDDLQNEIDRDRTRFDAVASLSIAAAGVLGHRARFLGRTARRAAAAASSSKAPPD